LPPTTEDFDFLNEMAFSPEDAEDFTEVTDTEELPEKNMKPRRKKKTNLATSLPTMKALMKKIARTVVVAMIIN
jgi:hypothetical protein